MILLDNKTTLMSVQVTAYRK